MDTFERVKALLADMDVRPAKVTPEASFRDDFSLDSLDVIELEMAVEEEFDFMVEDGALMDHPTVGALVKMIDQRLADFPT